MIITIPKAPFGSTLKITYAMISYNNLSKKSIVPVDTHVHAHVCVLSDCISYIVRYYIIIVI